MKKTYTKKQIQEAIAYWKKQLAKGNYRKVDEAIALDDLNPNSWYVCKEHGVVDWNDPDMAFYMNNDDYTWDDYASTEVEALEEFDTMEDANARAEVLARQAGMDVRGASTGNGQPYDCIGPNNDVNNIETQDRIFVAKGDTI